MKVKDVKPYTGPRDSQGRVPVYDITVKDTRLYFANGVLVSNSKRISLLDLNALLSGGGTETLRDAGGIRGQKQEDQFWMRFMQGHALPPPKVPRVYEKFVAQLKGAGINVIKDGSQLQVMALTDKDIDKLSQGRAIRSGDTVRFDKELAALPGGLFDPSITGGHGGNLWASLPLEEPFPNPVMAEPVRRILGLTEKQFEATIAGEHSLAGFGTGTQAIAKALDKIDVRRAIGRAQVDAAGSSKSKRDDAIRKLYFLKDSLRLGLHPRDWLLTKAPVLPPMFRPVSLMGGAKQMPLVADANTLYKELYEANDNLKEAKKMLGDDGVGPERLAVYHAFKAVTGLGEPITQKSQQKGIGGLLKSIFSSSPKFSTLQRKLLGSTVDNVGRGVIVPDPDLDMDSVGLPRDTAFSVYTRLIVRRLARRGMPISQALKEVKDKTERAQAALEEEMQERPVLINRAPVLHRWGIMAAWPKLVSGSTMRLSPITTKGFGADFDGDVMSFHVPTSDEAKREAISRLLPSKNLLSAADFKTPMNLPSQSYGAGLYIASKRKSKRRPRIFATKADALKAYANHKIGVDDPVEILG